MPDTFTGPDERDVDVLRDLLDLLENFTSNDQRARYLLASNWTRDRDARLAAPPVTYTGTDESGLQWLVDVYSDHVRVATRRDDWSTWSVPVVCRPEPLGVRA